jgi:large subunit ribosomal protein L15
MKGPFQLKQAKVPSRSIWTVNEDPERLDRFYNRMLGPGGDKMLPEEIKWLAVTHKSFDQGRRGFNDRLAFLGAFSDFLRLLFALSGHGKIGSSPDF